MIRSDLCDYIDANIVTKGAITIEGADSDSCDEKLARKNNASFISCTSKINNSQIENPED